MGRNPQPGAVSNCSKNLKDTGVFVIVGSGFALFAGATHFNTPRMGEIGNFTNDISPLVLCMGAWGLATGIGLLRAWRWARISMLVFSSLLAVFSALGVVAILFMPSGGVSGWTLFIITSTAVLINLIPLAIGVRWFTYFTRNNVKAYFQNPVKTP